jgi:Predicted membrane protein (DUF2127)
MGSEGVALYLRKPWARCFTIGATSSLLPIKLYEIVGEVHPIRVIVLLANVAIVAYLLVRKERFEPASGAALTERPVVNQVARQNVLGSYPRLSNWPVSGSLTRPTDVHKTWPQLPVLFDQVRDDLPLLAVQPPYSTNFATTLETVNRPRQ